MPEQNPTPLPWRVVEHDGGARLFNIVADSEDGPLTLCTLGNDDAWDDGEANARFIVEAVNGYAALQERLEAAEAALQSIDIEHCRSCDGTGDSWNPILGLFDGSCSSCEGTGEIPILTPLLARAEAAEAALRRALGAGIGSDGVRPSPSDEARAVLARIGGTR